MTRHLRRPITTDQAYLAAILDELEGQGEVLRQIRDRLPAPVEVQFEVREPAPVKPPSREGGAGERGGGGEGPVQVTEPAPPPPRRPAKKVAPRKATKTSSNR